MKMKEFVKFINIEINESSSQEMKSLYDLESALFVLELKPLLSRYENDDNTTSKKLLDPFLTLLAARWDRIQNSDAIEQYHPQTQGNRVSRRLAKLLGSAMTQPSAKFLMPTLLQAESLDGTCLLEMRPHQFVLNEANTCAIEIYPCLDAAKSKTNAKNKGEPKPLCNTSRGLNRKELTESERLRVINHSSFTKNYMQKLVACTPKELGESKKELKAQIEGADYHVVPFYGKEGKQRLRTKLYEAVNTREDLFAKLIKLPKEFWKPYCEHMKAADFVRVMSNSKMNIEDILARKIKIDAILTEKDFFSGDKETDRCRLFCLYVFYSKVRAKEGYHDSAFGYFARPFVYTKAHKIPAVEQMLSDILSVSDIGLLGKNITDVKSDLYKHQGALNDSDLGKFTAFMRLHIKESAIEKLLDVPVPTVAPQPSM